MPTLDLQKSKELKYKRKKMLLRLLGGKCVECGSTEKLEFDHIDPNTMSFRIGHRLDYSVKTLLAEVGKCQLLCRSCHTKKTCKDRGLNTHTHGTATEYNNHGCRCDKCRKAWADYLRPRNRISFVKN